MNRPPDRSLAHQLAEECFAMRVRMLDRAITNLYDAALRPLDLKVTQLDILLMVGKLGVARPSQVCEILRMDASTLSRNAERMVARGWLEVVPSADARVQPLRLTRRGHKIIERAFPGWQQAQAQVREMLGRAGALSLLKAAALAGLGNSLAEKL
jgi:DNA-binding MarR family transcriptional regulator